MPPLATTFVHEELKFLIRALRGIDDLLERAVQSGTQAGNA
jgi:hypothetical protein